jgi:hypothetical protein
MKTHTALFTLLIVSSFILWLAFPDKLFTINIHATYFLFGFDTIALFILSSYILFLMGFFVIKYVTKKSFL